MKTTTQKRAKQCQELSVYFKNRCMYAAVYGMFEVASHYARRSLLAEDFACAHEATSDDQKFWAMFFIIRNIQLYARYR